MNYICSGGRATLYRDASDDRYDNYEYLYDDQLTPSPKRNQGRLPKGRRRGRPNGNRRRRKHRRTQNRQGGHKTCGPAGSEGVCRNFMSCMLSGRRLDFQADQGRNCDDLFSVCCTKWPNTFTGPTLTRNKRKRNR